MLGQTSQTIKFYFYFTELKLGKTDLTVTCDVYRISDGTKIISNGGCTEIGVGGYYYNLTGSNTGTASDYFAIGKTSTTTVDLQQVPSLWVIGSTWVQYITADLLTIANNITSLPATLLNTVITGYTTANTWGKALNNLITYLTATPAPANTALSTANWPTSLATLLQNFTVLRITNLDNLDNSISGVLVDTATILANLPTVSAIIVGLLNAVATGYTTNSTVGKAINNILAFITAAPPTTTQIVNALPAGTIVARSSTSVDVTNITAKRGDSWFLELSGLGDISDRANSHFTLKAAGAQTDDESPVQIDENTGLLSIVSGGVVAVEGSITITDQVAGDGIIYLKGIQSAKLYARKYLWDYQIIDSAGDTITLTSGTFTVTEDATRYAG